jgi:RAB protein geranylgeranyltransferase component A
VDDKPLLFPFSQEEGYTYTSNLYLYDRNLASKELDFDSNPEQKEPFLRYAVSFQLQNRTEDLFRLSLPTLSDISHGIAQGMNQLHRYHTPARKVMDKLLRYTESYNDWIPEHGPDLLYDTGGAYWHRPRGPGPVEPGLLVGDARCPPPPRGGG